MGYTTQFDGQFNLDRPLQPEHAAYLNQFAATRRMARNAELAAQRPDPIREAAGLPIGIQGGYFVGAEGNFGQEMNADDIIEYNSPPTGQPSLWCQWVPNEDGTAIEWDQGEKFYDYGTWMIYLIEHFLGPWGYILNGTVEFQGEDFEDRGELVVADNRVGLRYIQTNLGDLQWLT